MKRQEWRTKMFKTLLMLACVVAAVGARSVGAQETRLTMQSDPGDYVGQGKSYDYVLADSNFNTIVGDADKDGKPDVVTVRVERKSDKGGYNPDYWGLDFATNKLSRPITAGDYPDAQRYPFQDSGHPGLDVSGQARGNNKLSGNFVISQLEFDYSQVSASNPLPTVKSFSATFEQHGEYGTGYKTEALRGTIKFNATTAVEPTPVPPTPVPPTPIPPTPVPPTPTPEVPTPVPPTPTPEVPTPEPPTPEPPTVEPDRIAPTASFTTPKHGAILNALPLLRGQMKDNDGGSGIAGVEVTIQRFDGKTWSGKDWESGIQRVPAIFGGSNWGFNNVPRGVDLPDGAYRIAVWPLDRAGNRGITLISLRIDATPPQLLWAAPAPQSTAGATLQYAVRTRDASGVASVEIAIQRGTDGAYWNGSDWQRALVRLPTIYSGAYWVLRSGAPPPAALNAGFYQLSALATDRAGNRADALQTLTLRGGDAGTISSVRLSRIAARPPNNAIDLAFSGPLQVASLRDPAVFRVRVNGVDAEIVGKSYAASDHRVTLTLSGSLLTTGARVEVAFSGIRDASGAALVKGYQMFIVPS